MKKMLTVVAGVLVAGSLIGSVARSTHLQPGQRASIHFQ